MGANAGIYAESPYSQGRRRLNHTMSLDARMTNGDDPKIRNYESSNRYLTILVLTHSIACACMSCLAFDAILISALCALQVHILF